MVYDAVEDARAAVRYVRSVAKDQNIDTDRILLMGESAGAITSLYYGYVAQAQNEGMSGNPGFSSNVTAIGAISGELKSQGYCKRVHPFPIGCQVNTGNDVTNNVTGINQVPLLSIHGTEDTIVPYINGKEVFD